MLPRKQRRGEGRAGKGEREAPSSLALHLREAKLISLARKGRGAREGGSGLPCGDQDAAELWTAPRQRHWELPAAPFWKPCDLFPLPSWTPTTDPSFCDPCPNGPGSGAAVLPLARSRKWVSGPGNPVLVDSAPPVKKEKFWGLVGGGRGRE